jgi:hypothetical protein
MIRPDPDRACKARCHAATSRSPSPLTLHSATSLLSTEHVEHRAAPASPNPDEAQRAQIWAKRAWPDPPRLPPVAGRRPPARSPPAALPSRHRTAMARPLPPWEHRVKRNGSPTPPPRTRGETICRRRHHSGCARRPLLAAATGGEVGVGVVLA